MSFLITYWYTDDRHSGYGMDTTVDPVAWLEDTQAFSETYFIINALPITSEEAQRINGKLKGM